PPLPRPPSPPLFPYTTLFRSLLNAPAARPSHRDVGGGRSAQAKGERKLALGVKMPSCPDPLRLADAAGRDRDTGADSVPVRPLSDRKSTRLNSSHVAISYAVF